MGITQAFQASDFIDGFAKQAYTMPHLVIIIHNILQEM